MPPINRTRSCIPDKPSYVILGNMNTILQVVLYSFASGVTVIIGGFLARIKILPRGESGREISHSIVAFGAGVLVAAVAFVLTPKAIDLLPLPKIVIVFLSGVILFLLLDRFINRRGGRLAQLMAMSMDYIPEAVALGAVFSYDQRTGLLLALFIGLQNLPESYNAFGDLVKSGFSPNKSLLVLAPFSFIGIIAAILGFSLLHGDESLVSCLMLFAAGGILYLVFQDIVPMIKYKRHWIPAFGVTLGFMLGMIGVKVLG
jgi:ZIP family zinc transporter